MSMKSKHPLGQLIEGAREANGWSYGDLEKRARKAGHTRSVSRQNMQRVATKYPVEEISANQMRALADATGLPLRTLVVAALTSAGLAPPNDDEVPLVERVRADPDLPEETKRALVEIIAPYKKRRRKPQPVAGDQNNVTELNRPRVTPIPDTAAASHGEVEPGNVGDDE